VRVRYSEEKGSAPLLIVADCIKDRQMVKISCHIAFTTLELAAKA
jgi:hypothetical protein